MDIQRRLHAMIDDILGQDDRNALIAFHELHDHQMPWLEQRVIALARRENWGWARIGRLLDRSRQHLHQRFGKIVPIAAARPDGRAPPLGAGSHAAASRGARRPALKSGPVGQ
jgi:hypothetical protein